MTIPAYNPVAINNASIISFMKTDPLGLGLVAIETANPGSDPPLLAAVNAVNPAFQVPADPMSADAFEQLFDPGEFATFTTAMEAQLQLMLTPGTLDIGTPSIQADLDALFANFPKTLANVRAAYTQSASGWAYWFGVGQTATQTQLDAARNSGSGNNF